MRTPPQSVTAYQKVGREVQRPVTLVPSVAVALLQVQPAYQVSLASRTAPIYVVAAKNGFSVLALNAGTAVSFAPLMNKDASVGVKALLLLFAPDPNTAET